MSIKNIKYGKPSRYEKKFTGLDITLFEDGWDKIKLQEPPTNDSSITKKEIHEIEKLKKQNTAKEKKEITKQDKKNNPFEFKFMKIVNSTDKKLKHFIDKLTDQLFSICIVYKRKWHRPRPFQLAKQLDVALDDIKTETGHSPSYPSGHALIATFLALYLGKLFPKQKKELLDHAKEVGENRIKGGIHFRSDVKAGEYLAKELYKLLKTESKNKTFKEWFVFNDDRELL